MLTCKRSEAVITNQLHLRQTTGKSGTSVIQHVQCLYKMKYLLIGYTKCFVSTSVLIVYRLILFQRDCDSLRFLRATSRQYDLMKQVTSMFSSAGAGVPNLQEFGVNKIATSCCGNKKSMAPALIHLTP